MYYLNELSKLDPQDQVSRKNLRNKYTFKAYASELDFIKTYSAFLLGILNKRITVDQYVDFNSEEDKVCLTLDSEPNKEYILTNNELIEVANEQMSKFYKNADRKDKNFFNEKINSLYESFDSFKKYFDENIKQANKEKVNESFADRNLR